MDNRRKEHRLESTGWQTEHLFPDSEDSSPLLFYYVNRSAKGICTFITDNCPTRGSVHYILRDHKVAFYEVRWAKEVAEGAFHLGLKILDHGHRMRTWPSRRNRWGLCHQEPTQPVRWAVI